MNDTLTDEQIDRLDMDINGPLDDELFMLFFVAKTLTTSPFYKEKRTVEAAKTFLEDSILNGKNEISDCVKKRVIGIVVGELISQIKMDDYIF